MAATPAGNTIISHLVSPYSFTQLTWLITTSASTFLNNNNEAINRHKQVKILEIGKWWAVRREGSIFQWLVQKDK